MIETNYFSAIKMIVRSMSVCFTIIVLCPYFKSIFTSFIHSNLFHHFFYNISIEIQ